MTNKEILRLAESMGFHAGLLPAEAIVFNAAFRKYCEENRCGQYGCNHSCPPACGTCDEMRARVQGRNGLMLMSAFPIGGYGDTETILRGKKQHNENMLALAEKIGDCICGGASHCLLCERCAMQAGKPCIFPEKRYSCLSAYCIDVAKTAEKCGLPFSWDEKKLCCYSIIFY